MTNLEQALDLLKRLLKNIYIKDHTYQLLDWMTALYGVGKLGLYNPTLFIKIINLRVNYALKNLKKVAVLI